MCAVSKRQYKRNRPELFCISVIIIHRCFWEAFLAPIPQFCLGHHMIRYLTMCMKGQQFVHTYIKTNKKIKTASQGHTEMRLWKCIKDCKKTTPRCILSEGITLKGQNTYWLVNKYFFLKINNLTFWTHLV